MCCILFKRKCYPLSEYGIKFFITVTVFAYLSILLTSFFDQKIAIWGTPHLPIAAEIQYTILILEEPIKADHQSNLQRNRGFFGIFKAILRVKISVFHPKKCQWRHYEVICSQNYKQWYILIKKRALSLCQGWFCKKTHVKSSFRSEEDKEHTQN